MPTYEEMEKIAELYRQWEKTGKAEDRETFLSALMPLFPAIFDMAFEAIINGG